MRPWRSAGHSQDFVCIKEVEGGLRRGWGYRELVGETRPEGPLGGSVREVKRWALMSGVGIRG